MNEVITLCLETESKIFLLIDPLVSFNKIIDKETKKIKLTVEYEFKTPLVIAFSFIEGSELQQQSYSINQENFIEETHYNRSFIDLFIANKEMIYNGSYYKLIN